ncbi:hypothetical protein ACWEVD_06520 [Nocardia thailandica]
MSGRRGAALLARLLWGLAYQSRPGTLLLLDPGHLAPNPFDAAPSDPVVVVPSDHTVFSRAAAVELRRRLRGAPPSDGTVRWQVFGLDAARAEHRRLRESGPGVARPHRAEPGGFTAIERIGGVIAVFGGDGRLREWAVALDGLDTSRHPSDHAYLDEYPQDGEVQIFRYFRRDVAVARVARAEVLAAAPACDPAELEQRIWAHAARVRRRRHPGTGRGPAGSRPPPGSISPT